MTVQRIFSTTAVWGRTKAEHDDRLDHVLRRLHHYRVRLNSDKCLFGVQQMNFIGHHFSANGVQPLQSNVESILNMPEPTDKNKLASFLGAAGYYMKFVPDFAGIARPLRALMRDDVKWDWTPMCAAAFNNLRNKIASPPILAHFNPDAPTFVTSDASADAIGAVLSQFNGGNERPVAYASRGLTSTERNYSATKREALASIWACERWHFYLYGRSFTIRTDHSALTTLLSAKGVGRRPMRLMRWADRLLQYNFQVVHLPGKSNVVTDMLSRHSAIASDELDSDAGESARLSTIFGSTQLAAILPNELAAATSKDQLLQSVIMYISAGWPTKSSTEDIFAFFKARDELSTCSGSVFKGEQACIPFPLRNRVLQLAHEGHPGITRMKQRLRDSLMAWN